VKKIDLTGQRFGRLTVISEAGHKHGELAWLCKCDCGKELVVTGYKLRSGHTQSCGCIVSEKARHFAHDLTSQRFGRLTVIERAGRIGSYAAWKCRCDCGKEVVVASHQLKQGLVKSCGCLQSELGQEQMKRMHSIALRDGTNMNIASKKTKSPFGVRGISRSSSKTKPFEAKLFFRGKVVFRKTFETLPEAIAARQDAEDKYYKPLIHKWQYEKNAQKECSDHEI